MRYAGRRRSETNPLRSIPLLQPAAHVLHRPEPLPTQLELQATLSRWAPPTDQQQREREMANAEAALAETMRVLEAARAGIGEANRTHTAPIVSNGLVIMPAQRFSAERIRQRKSYALRLFNQRRGQVAAARRRVDAARAALGQPSLAFVEEQQAVATELRASKRAALVTTDHAVMGCP